MKRVYLIPNMITAFGLACGLYVIFKVNMLEPGSGDYEVMLTSVILLLVAALADFIDGAIARAFRAESEFGVVFDSLADAISFGVAPSVLLLKSLSLQQGTLLAFFAAVGAMIFSLCGVLRLVRYSVQASSVKEHKGSHKAHKEISRDKPHFTGLPITAAAAAAVSINLFFLSSYSYEWFSWSFMTRSIILTCAMVVLGYFMVSRWKFPSLKILHIRVPSFHLAFLTVIFAVFLLYGIVNFFPVVLAIISWGYILLAGILSIIRIIAGKKSKTLADFEPEPEDDFDQFS